MACVDDSIAWPVAEALRDCLCEALTDCPTDRCCILPGPEIALPDCCSAAWVRVVRVFPTTGGFPRPATGANRGACPGIDGWAVDLELGVARCMPVMDEYGNPPTCAEQEAAARQVLADAHAMRRAIYCCDWQSAIPGIDPQYLLGAWTPFGPEGACGGGITPVTVEACGVICNNGTGEGGV